MNETDYYRKLSKQIDLKYHDLKELDRIGLFALLEIEGEKK